MPCYGISTEDEILGNAFLGRSPACFLFSFLRMLLLRITDQASSSLWRLYEPESSIWDVGSMAYRSSMTRSLSLNTHRKTSKKRNEAEQIITARVPFSVQRILHFALSSFHTIHHALYAPISGSCSVFPSYPCSLLPDSALWV